MPRQTDSYILKAKKAQNAHQHIAANTKSSSADVKKRKRMRVKKKPKL